MKPPMWAQTATPEVSWVVAPSDTRPDKNWVMNQNRIKNAAAMRGTRMNGPMNSSVRTWACGNRRRYAARTPAMAPDAPMLGTGESALTTM